MDFYSQVYPVTCQASKMAKKWICLQSSPVLFETGPACKFTFPLTHSVCALSLVASHCSIHPCFWVYCCTIVWLPFICNQLYYNSFTIIVLDITNKQSRLLSICRVLPKCHLRLSIMGSKQYQQWHTKAGSLARNTPKTLYWKMSKSKLRRSHTS